MRLISRKSKPYIATKDIEAYKWLWKTWIPFVLRSPIQAGTLWILRRLKTSGLGVAELKYSQRFEITQGLHAYRSLSYRCKQFNYENIRRLRLYRVIIPKGSKYYVDEDGETIVANRMWIKEKCKED